MSEQEAIEKIIEMCNTLHISHNSQLGKAISMAIQALEKQVGKKPIERFTGDEYVCECPVCKGITATPNEQIIESIQYCAWCGQKLDWSDEE